MPKDDGEAAKVRKLKQLREENAWLKRLVSDLSLGDGDNPREFSLSR